MLTARENFLETIHGGHPDCFVKQFEFFPMPYSDPFNATNPMPWAPDGKEYVDFWGVTWMWPEGTPGGFPVQDDAHLVLKDVTKWKEVVKAPPLEYSEELWKAAQEDYAKYDRNEYLVGPTMFPGLFELTHSLMGMENAMISLYEEPEAMHELIDYVLEWEMAYIKQMGERLHPDVVFQNDDWGSSQSTFMSVEMFQEFYLEPYKKLYRCFKENGIKVAIHHSDSFAASYVPMMIEMGIDVWQGGTILNDIPKLVKQYGGQISFMTGIDTALVDKPGWTRAEIAAVVRKACTECGTKYFCPCQTQGAPFSIFEGVYEAANEEIDKMSKEMF